MRLPSSWVSLPPTLLLALPPLLATANAFTRITLVNNLTIDITKEVDCTRKTLKGDTIFVHYRGTLLDGTEFDSSYKRNKPFSFTLGTHAVIEGWDLGLLGMCTWEQRKLTIPPELAYGDADMGVIPPGSTLVFETELRGIQGVEAGPSPTGEEVVPTATTTMPAVSQTPEGTVGIQTAAPEQQAEPEDEDANSVDSKPPPEQPPPKPHAGDNGECKLLGPFSLLVQGALGLLALLSLVYKRWRERPRRPLKIWGFDVSKQVFGSLLLHVLNLLMSMLSSGKFDVQMKPAYVAPGPDGGEELQQPNGCSFYLLNLAIDTTIGIPILVFFLRVLHRLFMLSPLANPPQSLTSGNYGQPPKFTWWLKQFLIYVIGLVLMKLCVFALFQLFPWLGWVGDWALRWTEGDERLQIAFVMFIFPLIMNAAQYWIIDSFIKDPAGESYAYEEVSNEREAEEDENEGLMGGRRSDSADGEVFVVGDEDAPRVKEANPTVVPAYHEEEATSSGGSSRGLQEEEDKKTS